MNRRFPDNDRRRDVYSALRTWDLADAGTVCNAPVTIRGVRCASCLGRRAVAVRAEARAKRKLNPPSLRTVSDCLRALERAYGLAINSGKDKVSTATAICRIVERAHAILLADVDGKSAIVTELLKENPRLSKALDERERADKPDLAVVK